MSLYGMKIYSHSNLPTAGKFKDFFFDHFFFGSPFEKLFDF